MKKIKFLGGMSAAFLATVALLNCGGGSAKTYHVKFTNGNELVTEKDYKENEVITAPANPEPYKDEEKHKTYTFEAWYDGDFKFETGLKATKDYNFVAKFDEEDTQYHVYFKESEDDTEPDVQTLSYGAPITVPEDLDDYKGEDHYWYNFTGWFDGEDELEEGDTCKGEQTFVAKFVKGDPIEYTVEFYDDDKTSYIYEDSGTYTESVELPETPQPKIIDDYDYNFDKWVDDDGVEIPESATFADTLDHVYYATYTKGDLHKYKASLYMSGASAPFKTVEYTVQDWTTKARGDILSSLPVDTDNKTYSFNELIPVETPEGDVSYTIFERNKYFDLDLSDPFASLDPTLFQFVNNGDEADGWSLDETNHLIEINQNKGTAFINQKATDFALDFFVSSSDDARFSLIFGASNDQLLAHHFVGGEGPTPSGSEAGSLITDGLVALVLNPNNDTPIKLFHSGKLQAPTRVLHNAWVKADLTNGVDVNVSIEGDNLNVTMNGVHLYNLQLPSNYYKGGFIGFARGLAGTGNITHKLSGSLSLKSIEDNKYFSHNYTDETSLAGLSHGIDLVNRNQASVGRDSENRMIFNADNGGSYIQTTHTYGPDVHIKFKAQNIDDWASGAANDRFSIFFTDLAKQQKNYFQDNAVSTLGENGDFSVTPMVNGDSTAVKLCINGTSTPQTILNKPTGKITDLKEYDLKIANGKCSLYIDGYKTCEFDVPTATTGTKKYIGICGTKKWDVKELAITENSDQVAYNYTQLPDGYGPGVGLSYTNRGGSGSAAVSSGALTLTDHANGNLYTDASFKDNFTFSLNYKSETSGCLAIVFGSTSPTTTGYGACANMGEGLVGLLISCPASGEGSVTLYDNSTTADDPVSIPEIIGGAVSNYVEVTIMVIGGTLSVIINYDVLNPVLTKQIAQTTGEGQICVTRGETGTGPWTFGFQHIAAGSLDF